MSHKLELDTLYKIVAIDRIAPQGGIEIISAKKDVTIRATTDSHFSGTYSDLPSVITDAAQGDFYKSDVLSVIKYISVSCADTDAEIILSGCSVKDMNLTATVVFTPNTISCSGNDFISTMLDLFPGIELKRIAEGAMEYLEAGDLWKMIICDMNGKTLGTYQQYTADWESKGFTFTGTPQDGDIVAFECNIK